MIGRFYEDFEPGAVYRHPLGRTISDADNTWFTLLTLNTNQIHFNRHHTARTGFGRNLVNSCLTLALVTGMSVIDTSFHAMANLGWDEIRLPNPVFEGDTVYAESRVLDKRESQSRPEVGIVHIETRGLNQDGKVVISYHRRFMVYKRGHDPETFPTPEEAWD